MGDVTFWVSDAEAVEWEAIEVQSDGTWRPMISLSKVDPKREGAAGWRMTTQTRPTPRALYGPRLQNTLDSSSGT